MRILYIHQYFATRDSSAGTRSYEFSRWLVDNGHQVTVITGPSHLSHVVSRRFWLLKRLDISGIDVRVLNVPYSNYFSASRRILSFVAFALLSTLLALTLRDIDIVFATSTPLTVGIPALVVTTLRRVPFVFEVRDLWPDWAVTFGVLREDSLLVTSASWLERKCYDRACRVIATIEPLARVIASKGVPQGKIEVIPHGADLDLFYPRIRRGDSLIRRRKGDFVVLYAGAHGVANGLDRLLDVASELDTEPRIRFVFVGDGKAKPSLVLRAGELGLRNVEFLPPVPKGELPSLMAEADICVISAAATEAASFLFPNKLFDYLASGKPVVINFDGLLAQVLTDHQVGVSAGDSPAAMASAIRALRNHPERVAHMGERARALAEKYDRKPLAAQLCVILEQCIGAT